VARIHWVKSAVEPAPSDLTTGMIWICGRTRSGLSVLISGSSQYRMTPVKMSATVLPDSRRLVTRWVPIFRLYMSTVPPATSGMYA
jgi:hypothetical protein